MDLTTAVLIEAARAVVVLTFGVIGALAVGAVVGLFGWLGVEAGMRLTRKGRER